MSEKRTDAPERVYSTAELVTALRLCAADGLDGRSAVRCDECVMTCADGKLCYDNLNRLAADRLEELERENRELRERNRWRAVSEELPKVGELVQTISDEGVREGCWLNVNGWWWLSIGISTKDVTHWRPVPKGLEDVNG